MYANKIEAAAAERLNTYANARTLNGRELAYAVTHLAEAVRAAKTTVAKFSTKRIEAIINDARAEANDSDMPKKLAGVTVRPPKELLADVIELPTKKATGAHAACSHEATKVARAKCRRERARA